MPTTTTAAKKTATKKTTTSKPATIYKAQTLHQVPPGALVLERNIRDAQPDDHLVASVKALGVLQPIVAVVNADGQLVVRLGHRRTLAALAAARDVVPVYVAGDDNTDDAAEIIRVISQHDENTLRAGLTAGDDLHVVEQLAAFGLTVDQMVDQARLGKDQVETALRVSRSKVAAKATEKYSDVSLEQMATVAEFEDDAETVKALVVAAVQEPATFEHIAQRARDERIRENHKQGLLDELKTAGVPVVKQPEYGDKTKPLYRLRDDKGKELTEATHRDCPGHVAWLVAKWLDIDADGNVVASKDSVRRIQLAVPEYGCKDQKKHGHVDAYSGGTSKPKAADLPEAEREKAKAERRLVIENNKAWDAAEVVRREWIGKAIANLKTPPKGAGAFIVRTLSENRSILTHDGHGPTREKLCAEWALPTVRGRSRYTGQVVGVPQGASDNRGLVIALVQVLAAHESATDRMDWRRDGKTERIGYYLQFLESCGYGLSDVEKFAISSKTVR